ncbi:MAG TPA: Rid family hydrolase [Thermoanaerobaculia bacterium]|nr:Rid family hydrolase [Thermoanaerobaculia bacterium]
MTGRVVRGYVVPGLPHPLLAPERSPAWSALRRGFEEARREIAASGADLVLLYSTQWISIIGHQMQADPEPSWIHVDPEWHELGTMPYRFRVDAEFAKAYESAAKARGLAARTVSYRGFPIDTGTVTALKLLATSDGRAPYVGTEIPGEPENAIPACVVSCNMYADRAETLVLGKAARDAIEKTGRRAIAVAVSALSARMFTEPIDPADDRISSLKDDEWNRKILEILGEGRLEDVSQLAREFSAQANGDQKMKAIWWLAALMGEHNDYEGRVVEYQPLWGTGGAVVSLTPTGRAAARLEFDEESVEVYAGERNVLTGDREGLGEAPPSETPAPSAAVFADAAPRPVGPYPHARRVGDLLYLSGIGPRTPGTDDIPGGPVRDAQGGRLPYDVTAQTRQAIANVRTILEAAGSSLEKVRDVTVFLIDMDRDFAAFNAVWGEVFSAIAPTRTTVAVSALPTPIAVELKVVAEP